MKCLMLVDPVWPLYAHTPPFMPIKYLECMSSLVGLSVFGTLGVTCEVDVAVGCVLAHTYKNVGSTCPYI